MITTITDTETRLTNTLRQTTEALTLVTAERDALARTKLSDQAAYVALRAERDALRVDAERTKLTKIERECLLIGKEIQRAAGELPYGYEIEILVERGYGGVITLERPDYTRLVFDDTVDGLSHCITQAVDTAMKEKS